MVPASFRTVAMDGKNPAGEPNAQTAPRVHLFSIGSTALARPEGMGTFFGPRIEEPHGWAAVENFWSVRQSV